MKYTEKEFSDNFIENISTKKTFGVCAFMYEQIGSSSGIPDVVMITENDTKNLSNFKDKYPNVNLTNGHARIITTLYYKKSQCINSLYKKAGLNMQHFNKAFSELKKMGIIEETTPQSFVLSKSFNIPPIKIWSIEFKLNDWKKALVQSLRYRTFSTHVLLVMPEEKKKLLGQKKSIFKKYKIGIGTYGMNSKKLEYIVKPQKCGALSKAQYLDTLDKLYSHPNFRISIK